MIGEFPRIELWRMPMDYPATNRQSGIWRTFQKQYKRRAKAVAERTGKPCEVYDRDLVCIDVIDP